MWKQGRGHGRDFAELLKKGRDYGRGCGKLENKMENAVDRHQFLVPVCNQAEPLRPPGAQTPPNGKTTPKQNFWFMTP